MFKPLERLVLWLGTPILAILYHQHAFWILAVGSFLIYKTWKKGVPFIRMDAFKAWMTQVLPAFRRWATYVLAIGTLLTACAFDGYGLWIICFGTVLSLLTWPVGEAAEAIAEQAKPKTGLKTKVKPHSGKQSNPSPVPASAKVAQQPASPKPQESSEESEEDYLARQHFAQMCEPHPHVAHTGEMH